jgi:hypothetical protein
MRDIMKQIVLGYGRSLLMMAIVVGGTIGCGSTAAEEFTEPEVGPWSRAFGTEASFAQVSAIHVGASGNIALTGTFSEGIDFGAGTLNATAQPSIYVAKLSAGGDHIWSGRTGGGDDNVTGIAMDRGGSTLLTGYFNGKVDFGTGELSGSNDVFLARFGASGIPLWSRQYGDVDGWDAAGGVAVSGTDGSIHLTGRAGGDIDFGGGAVASGQWNTMFVAKLAADGAEVWSRGFIFDQFADGRKIGVDKEGNTFIAGEFSGTLDLGGGSLGGLDDYGFFLAKFDQNGNHVWSKGFTTYQGIQLRDIAVAPDGSVLLVGNFGGDMDFGGGALTSVSYNDVFLVKLAGDGSHRFSMQFGEAGSYPNVAGIGVDGGGNVYVGGTFDGSLSFGSEVLTSVGSGDVFLAKLDKDGKVVASGSFGDDQPQALGALAVDTWGNTVLAGVFSGTIDFGTGKLDAETSPKLFVARLP